HQSADPPDHCRVRLRCHSYHAATRRVGTKSRTWSNTDRTGSESGGCCNGVRSASTDHDQWVGRSGTPISERPGSSIAQPGRAGVSFALPWWRTDHAPRGDLQLFLAPAVFAEWRTDQPVSFVSKLDDAACQ